MRFRLVVDGDPHEVEVLGAPAGPVVRIDGAEYRARLRQLQDRVEIRIGKAAHRIVVRGSTVEVDGQTHAVVVDGLEEVREGAVAGGGQAGAVEVRPPMPGRVVRVAVRTGDSVRRGQTLAVLEAMKMQNEIPAPSDGIVESVGVAEGESIGADRVIAVLRTGRGAA